LIEGQLGPIRKRFEAVNLETLQAHQKPIADFGAIHNPK